MKDDEFFDALDQSLDRIDRETDNPHRTVSISRNAFTHLSITHELLRLIEVIITRCIA